MCGDEAHVLWISAYSSLHKVGTPLGESMYNVLLYQILASWQAYKGYCKNIDMYHLAWLHAALFLPLWR